MTTTQNGTKCDDDEDDPIVEEIPIYASKQLNKRLYVLQYQLHSKTKPMMPVEKVYFKPENKEVKIEHAIDTQSPSYDMQRAEELASIVNESEKNPKDKLFKHDIVDKVIYSSSKAVQDSSIYAIGAFNGRELHLTPIEGILNLTPSLDYLDKCLKAEKSDNLDEEDEEDKHLASEAKAVTVKFAKNDARNNEVKEKSSAEKFIKCGWETEEMCKNKFTRKLFTEATDDITGHLSSLNKAEYLNLLIHQEQNENKSSSLPVQEQCRLLLRNAQIIQFQQLVTSLTASDKSITPDTIIKCLPQVAVLVKGNWIVKSDILYPQDSFSGTNSVPADLMCKGRDYVLYQFTQSDFVERLKVTQTIRLPPEEVKEIFTGIAKLNHRDKGWELLFPEDKEFLKKHSDIADRQKRLWDQRWDILKEFYK